jgi:ubiquinol-cytochrome c reductase cytochrome c1 subunit
MNKVLATLLLGFSVATAASATEVAREHVAVDVFDFASVQRGAGYFANYCLGCHSLRQVRYSRIASDLNLSEATMRQEFMFGDVKFHSYMRTAMTPADAEAAFGVVPPDLSLVVRAKGADWVYSYLKGFYADPERPFGVNNVVVPNVAMPNVLWSLQGTQEAVFRQQTDGTEVPAGVRLVQSGRQSPQEFDRTLTDLTNFLAYVSEPARLERLPLGKYVIAFLIILAIVLYKLKKEYWKDIE